MPAGQSVPTGARWGVGLGAGSLHWLPLLLPPQCCHPQQPHPPLTAEASATRLSLAAVLSSGTICDQHRHARPCQPLLRQALKPQLLHKPAAEPQRHYCRTLPPLTCASCCRQGSLV